MPEVTINGRTIHADEGATILQLAREVGVHIPTLCNMEGFDPAGACRVCVVEVEGAPRLAAACATPIRDGMVVHTNSRRARRGRRSVVELLLSEHSGDCRVCDRGEDCELKALAQELGIRELPFEGERPPVRLDHSTEALVRDSGKCIKCRRCVTACTAIQAVGALWPQGRGYGTTIGPAFGGDLSEVPCVQCGQCAAVCPVGAISENSHIENVWAALDDPEQTVVVQTAPAIRAALGEEFGLPPGTLVTGEMVAALRRLGFDKVFDTNFAADLTIIEEGNELLTRLKRALVEGDSQVLPQFTSCSPGWINFAEEFYPQFLPNLSTCKSPQQMFGAMAKTYYAESLGIEPSRMTVVSVMPCTAKKYEASRPEMASSGVRDVDYVLTTRELAQLIKAGGIDFTALAPETMDAPLGISSGAADIFANTGGVMEAALRTVYEVVTGRRLPAENLHITPLAGLQGVKEAEITFTDTVEEWRFLEGVTARVAVSHGLGNTAQLLDRIDRGEAEYHFVEIMSCPGGCIGGGGQPRVTDNQVRRKRIDAIYREDEGKKLRTSHENPAIQELYAQYLGAPLGERSHHLLHTAYAPKACRGELIK
ncbi:MAG: NADH-dependent [FeFe] hydrogenase, group A6 [Alkalispirochaeta sp.]